IFSLIYFLFLADFLLAFFVVVDGLTTLVFLTALLLVLGFTFMALFFETFSVACIFLELVFGCFAFS
ncbi:hypothetical protein AAUPMC_20081, partial [Pasteurella multocida subsp. multocida str. Anand1_cattle]